MQKINVSVSLSQVSSVDLSSYERYLWWNPAALSYFTDKHYLLMALIASQLPLNSKIADLGTFSGASAIAFASNPNVKVFTCDVTDSIPSNYDSCKSLPNVRFTQGNCLNLVHEFIDADVILLDIDPHQGIQERKLLDILDERGFKGLLICDDIWLNDGMRKFWSSVKQKKINLTSCGHYSGTGAVVFDENTIDVRIS